MSRYSPSTFSGLRPLHWGRLATHSAYYLASPVLMCCLLTASVSAQGHQFQAVHNPFPPVSHSAVAWGDFNADGWMDVIITGLTDSGPITRLFMNRGPDPLGNPIFDEMITPDLPDVHSGAVAWGDYDGDGRLDLAIVGNRSVGSAPDLVATVYRNLGPGLVEPHRRWRFEANSFELPGVSPGAVAFVDFDNDGDMDLVLTGQTDQPPHVVSRLFVNVGRSGFSRNTYHRIAYRRVASAPEVCDPEESLDCVEFAGTSIGVGDLNRDGFLDLVFSAEVPIGIWVDALVFQNRRAHVHDHLPFASLGVVDGTRLSDRLVHVEREVVGGSMSALMAAYRHTVVSDFDMNGVADVFFETHAALRDEVGMLFSRKYGVPTPPGVARREWSPGLSLWTASPSRPGGLLPMFNALAAGDIMNTGYSIVLSSGMAVTENQTSPLIYAYGQGFGDMYALQHDNLTPLTHYHGLLALAFGSMALADFDRDGRLDVLMTGVDGNSERRTYLYRNTIPASNAPPSAPQIPAVGATAGNATGMTFSWHHAEDDLMPARAYRDPERRTGTPYKALHYALRIGTTPGGSEILRPQARVDGRRLVPGLGDGILDTTFTLVSFERPLPPGQYYWSVQAIDNSFQGSAWSQEHSFVIEPETEPEYLTVWMNALSGILDWGDFDGDGDIDLLTSSEYGTIVHRNVGVVRDTLRLEQYAVLTPGLYYYGAVAWADIDNDGDLDFVVTGTIGSNLRTPYTAVYRNNSGQFEPLDGPFIQLRGPVGVAWLDVDSDGLLDLLLAGSPGDGFALTQYATRLYRNLGDGRFVEMPLRMPTTGTFTAAFPDLIGTDISVVDYNIDGRPDVLISGYERVSATQSRQVTMLFRNEGPVVYQAQPAWSFARITPVIEDATGNLVEGFPAIGVRKTRWINLFQSSSQHLAIMGDGWGLGALDGLSIYVIHPFMETGNRLRFERVHSGLGYAAFDFIDIDGDGRLDMVTSNAYGIPPEPVVGHTLYHRNTGNWHPFDRVEQVARVGGGVLAVGPFLGPDEIDVMIVGHGRYPDETGPTRRLLRNRSGAFAPPAPQNLTTSLQGTSAVLGWTAVPGMTHNLFVRRSDGREITASMADPHTGQRRVLRSGNAGRAESFTIRDLPAGQLTWGVQSIDGSRRASAFTVSNPGPSSGLYVPSSRLRTNLRGVTEGATAWADVDGDGDLDVAVCGETSDRVPNGQINIHRILVLYLNDGQDAGGGWAFTPIWSAEKGLKDCTLEWGDFDSDGDPDLLVTGSHTQTGADHYITKLYRNDGGELFDSGIPLPGVAGGVARFGDYTGDGRLDVAIMGHLPTGGGPNGFYRNAGPQQGAPGGWHFEHDIEASATVCLPGTTQIRNLLGGSLAWLDFDSDGALDLVVMGNFGGNPRSILFRNEGGGSFTCRLAATPHAMPESHHGLSVGDYNDDGLPDLLVQSLNSGGTHVVRNQGGGTFANEQLLLPYWKGSAQWGDFTNNGRLDAVVVGHGNGFLGTPHVFVNQEDHTLAVDPISTAILTPGARWETYAMEASWADIDNDGDLDLVISGAHNDVFPSWERVTWIFESGAADRHVNTPPEAPPGLTHAIADSVVVLTWESATDAETASEALTYNVRVGTTPGGVEVVSPLSLPSGRRRVVARGNAEQATRYHLHELTPGQTYYWSVQAIDNSYAGSSFAPEQSFVFEPTAVSVEHPDELPAEFALRGNYPNPFNPRTVIIFDLPEHSVVVLQVYDLVGREVISEERRMEPGFGRQLSVDGSRLSSGVYLYRLMAHNSKTSWVRTGQIVLLK